MIIIYIYIVTGIYFAISFYMKQTDNRNIENTILAIGNGLFWLPFFIFFVIFSEEK